MASGWHNKLGRISRMDWAEVRTRLGQELSKRGDLVRNRLGMASGAVQLSESPATPGKFFFGASNVQDRVGLIRQHPPRQAAEIVREADAICQHKFRLLGYDSLDYGSEIDWHLDRVHGKRAPLIPWFQIPFLDFNAVGDHKVTWELNRHQHLVTLAKAHLLTNDEKYVRELAAQWHSWIKANPYPLGINWGSTLEVAFRALSWIWVDQLLAETAKSKTSYGQLRTELLPVLAFHGRYIERYLSTYFSPNTHLLGEAVTMFFLGTLYPQMPGAVRWKNEGWKIVLHEAERQVRPDGVYFEQSLYYHVYALDFFLYARLLASSNDIPIPATFDAILLRMLSVVEALAQAGPPEGFGDDDGGRLFDARLNRTENMTDPLALGLLTYKRKDLAAALLTEESIWIFGECAVAELAGTKYPATATSAAFSDGGLYILADAGTNGPGADSQKSRQLLMIDAGPQGVGRSGHGHADALSLRLTMNGSRWLVDSGSGVYISQDPADRNALRGTSAHNTMLVDGKDQAVPSEPFSWTDIPTTRAEDWITGRTFTYFSGSHNGYAGLADPVTHRRCVLRVHPGTDGGIWLVRDVATGAAEHDLELRWHFSSDLTLHQNGASEIVASRSDAEQSALRLIWPVSTPWRVTIAKSQISPAYGCYDDALEVRCEARVKLPAEIATAMVSHNMTSQAHEPARMTSTQAAKVQLYEVHDGSDSHAFFFALGKQPWSCGPWSSDAELLYYSTAHEKLMQLIVIGSSSVGWQGQPLLTAQQPVKFFEWHRCGINHAEPESFLARELFDELTKGSMATDPSISSSTYAEKH